ncbi:MAG: purine-nucleoside phosphorylase [Chloroflexota bacterium]|nr:purine-nucleoside phosphorylase [Chloroflexota bacterium]
MTPYEQVAEATASIRAYTPMIPSVMLILGSGLGDLVDEILDPVVIPYAEIPHFARSTVVGHVGRLHIGLLDDVPVAVMQGRLHLYEGHSLQTLTLPVRAIRMLGADTLIVTNAAGGVNPAYQPGDFMLIRDHINMPGLAGINPLIGPNDERFGERFPPLARAYDADLRALARSVAKNIPDLTLHEGVYTMVGGPNFETGAELRFLGMIGTDAVGMSTVPEVLVACHMGMRVLGLSLITNTATGEETETVNHVDVLTIADAVRPRFTALVRGIVKGIG